MEDNWMQMYGNESAYLSTKVTLITVQIKLQERLASS